MRIAFPLRLSGTGTNIRPALVICPSLSSCACHNAGAKPALRGFSRWWPRRRAARGRLTGSPQADTKGCTKNTRSRHAHPRHHDPGHRIECGEIHAGGGSVPRGHASGAFRGTVQAAEHVEQRRRHRGRRRDRPRPSPASDGLRAAPVGAYEPHPAEARNRQRVAGDRAGAAP